MFQHNFVCERHFSERTGHEDNVHTPRRWKTNYADAANVNILKQMLSRFLDVSHFIEVIFSLRTDNLSFNIKARQTLELIQI